ncbi:lysM and putative peptidoglycan-binding domain-containing protein 3 [Athalia rosae]|uniref:lysM and putative peptidoglycan-binding domain-containing protein 3 n=1 Tax=Athalia rosae TaxID=37344 RepID=UPI000626093E|nr:lysM and putative peptidoglycan-binding domain-containing protein 3 [Athalia rosae]
MRKISSNINDGQKAGRQTVYQRGGQRDGSPHYVLLYSDAENSGDEESIPLRKISLSQAPPRRVEVIKIQLQPEDTLQALSLRYGSTISELKRINNIHKDNEIFAHRTFKVPVKPFSLLTETLNEAVNPNGRTEVGNLVEIEEQQSTSREEQIINLIATPILQPPSKSDFNYTVLNSLYEPLTTSSCEAHDTLEEGESAQLLAAEETKQEHSVTDSFMCSGADWGLSWSQVVGCSLLLGFGGPLIYFFLYLADHSSKQHSTTGH